MLSHEMDTLTRDMVTAFDARVAALSKLRKDNVARMQRFADRRKRRATQLRSDLARRDGARRTASRSTLQSLAADRHAAHGTWQTMSKMLHGRRAGGPTSFATKPAAEPTKPAAEPMKPAAKQ